jgi:thiol-disulfide isomerase/thioredoxin
MKRVFITMFLLTLFSISNSLADTQYPRKIVMEEGTGTWCGWCVRGIETIERLNKEYPDNFIAIALHHQDEMSTIENYDEIAKKFHSFPSSFINRTMSQDPDYPSVKPIIEKMKGLANAKISVSAFFGARDSSSVIVSTETVFGFGSTESEYRIAYVVVEDHVGPYSQNNSYGGLHYNENNYMYDWTRKEGNVRIEYNDVARGIYGGVNGIESSVPKTIKEGETYKYDYSFKLPKNIQDKKNIRIVALLIDNNSCEIINADRTGIKYDEDIVNQTFGFFYNGQLLVEYANIETYAEIDLAGSGEKNCKTSNVNYPEDGLMLKKLDGTKVQGKVILEVLGKTFDFSKLQWSIGGDYVAVNSEKQERAFSSSDKGVVEVLLEALGIKNEGYLEAKLTATVGKESHTVRIKFISKNPKIGDVNATSSQIWWSNHNESDSGGRWHIVQQAPTTCSFAIHIGPEDLGINGATIAAASIYMCGTGFRDMKVWVSKTLPKYGEVGNLESVSVPNESIVIDDFTSVPFSKEYELGADGLYVGYTYDYPVNTEGFGNAGTLGFTSEEYRQGSLWVMTDKNQGWWESSYQLKMKLLLGGGVYASNAATPIGFEEKGYYVVSGDSELAKLSIKNTGRNTIKSIDYLVYTGSQSSTEMHLDLEKQLEGFGQSTNVEVKLPADASPGKSVKQLVISKVNGETNPYKDSSISTALTTLSEKLPTKVVVEELTGTWCTFCPRGIVGLNMMNKEYGDNIITIAVHGGEDPMKLAGYNYGGSFPSCYINRGDKTVDPYYGEVYGETPFGVKKVLDKAFAKTVIGAISASAEWTDETKTAIKINTETRFAADMSNSRYAIGFIVLEDGLKGEGSDWAQVNGYSGDFSDPNFEEIAVLPDRVIGMEYDHVPVAVWEPYRGVNGSVPSTIQENQLYFYSYVGKIQGNTHIQDKERLTVVVLLLDNDTQRIINADKCQINEYNNPPAPKELFEFRYEGKTLEDGALVTINAEEDSWGFGEMGCETNPSSDPKNGLILVTSDGSKKSGSATLTITKNTFTAQMIQWCMGGECTPMNDKTTLSKSFTTDNDGICQVQFDASNIKTEGELEAKLAATIGSDTKMVNIKFVNNKTNGINVIYSDDGNDVWYDLNGTRLESAPTRKGLYIKNGEKVVR